MSRPAINSFTQTVNTLIKNVNTAMESVVKLNESMTTSSDTVLIETEVENSLTGDSSIVTYTIPSLNNIINQMSSIQNSIDTFINGTGIIYNKDGSTFRQVITNPTPEIPTKITGLSRPISFNTRNNWFFESMMFPQLIVSFDLKNKINDTSDRVAIKRVIFNNSNNEETQWFIDNFVSLDPISYSEAIDKLLASDKIYWEDDEVQMLPLSVTPYTGSFKIIDINQTSTGLVYYLDTINFGQTTDSSIINNLQLSIGNQLKYNKSIFRITQVNIEEKSIRLVPILGMDNPSVNRSFSIYSDPFSSKIVNIPVGYNECNILFIKGVDENYNLLGSEWSDSISFYSNDLILTGSTLTLEDYYSKYVSDFGKQLEGQAKEGYIPAFMGIIPDAPTITSAQFGVSQINAQLNSSLDNESIKNTQIQIESTKSLIQSLKNTISQQKSELNEETDIATRASLQSQIDKNIQDLSQKTIEYRSLVSSLSTVAYENSAVLADPKYRIRGFFEIPAPKPLNNSIDSPLQEIIQFEYAYRYLRLDNTGNKLNTYNYTDPSTGQSITGVYTDWITVLSPIKKKIYDSTLDKYIWEDENIQDGQAVNINQVDIPIQKGEKVELKIRSISEAGWPLNPLKSDWSDSVIIEFPSNLQSSDQVANILTSAQSEDTAIKLQETLDSAGITTHIEDTVPNPNTQSGIQYKHLSRNIEVTIKEKSDSGIITSEYSTDLQSFFDNLAANIYITVQQTISPSGPKTYTLQQILNQIIADASITF